MTKHLTAFEGGNALSAFRAQALLGQLQQVNERITGVSARAVLLSLALLTVLAPVSFYVEQVVKVPQQVPDLATKHIVKQ